MNNVLQEKIGGNWESVDINGSEMRHELVEYCQFMEAELGGEYRVLSGGVEIYSTEVGHQVEQEGHIPQGAVLLSSMCK